MTVRSLSFVLATVLFGSMLRAEPDKKKPDAGISVSIHDGKVEVDGLQDMIDDQLDSAFDSIDFDNIPAPVRGKLKEKLGNIRNKVKTRLKHMDVKDMDKFGQEMEQLGNEISKEMEGFGSDFQKQFSKDFAKKFSKKIKIGALDKDDDDDIASVDVDDNDDLADAISDLGDMKLAAPQKDQIAKLRADSDKQVAAAKQALEAASKTLKDQLANAKASDADIAKSIDAVTQQEAAIRKARILAWVHARAVLDDAQRKKVESAAAKAKTK